KLESLAHNPEICLAWDLRGTDRASASAELARVQLALAQLQRDPNADPQKVAELNQYGYKLQVAVNSPAILRKVSLDILNEARKIPPAIDEDATAWRAEIAAAMKGATAKVQPEPPPQYGKMSGPVGRRKVLQ